MPTVLETNLGLGAALNYGLERARGAWQAYLPSDDVYYAEHLASLAAASLPILQRANAGAIVATQELVRWVDLGFFFADMGGLGAQLTDAGHLTEVRANVWREREQFVFDSHVGELVAFFRRVIAQERP